MNTIWKMNKSREKRKVVQRVWWKSKSEKIRTSVWKNVSKICTPEKKDVVGLWSRSMITARRQRFRSTFAWGCSKRPLSKSGPKLRLSSGLRQGRSVPTNWMASGARRGEANPRLAERGVASGAVVVALAEEVSGLHAHCVYFCKP